jgi:hypothetical protein
VNWFTRGTDEQKAAQRALEATLDAHNQLSRQLVAQLAQCRLVGLDTEIRLEITDPSTFEYREGRVTQVLK